MSHYSDKERKALEAEITEKIRAFEMKYCIEVTAINFERVAMCDTDGQQIKGWNTKLSTTELGDRIS